MIPRMIKRVEEDGCDVIAAPVPARVDTEDVARGECGAWIKSGAGYERVDLDSGDLLPISFIGSGVLLFPCSALSLIPQPWFRDAIKDFRTWERMATTDTAFVAALSAYARLSIWVDTTIKVTHLDVRSVRDGD